MSDKSTADRAAEIPGFDVKEGIKLAAAIVRERNELRETVADLVKALGEAKGYILNAKIDLEAGSTKRGAIQTLESGLNNIDAALRLAKGEQP